PRCGEDGEGEEESSHRGVTTSAGATSYGGRGIRGPSIGWRSGPSSVRRSSEVGMARRSSPTDDVENVAAADPIRVLLCDDAEGFRALMRISLAEDPAIEIVGEAADGEAGVDAAAALQPDVVLLDMSM